MNNTYLQEAIRIGNQLLDLAEKDEHGVSWETILRTPDYIDSWHKSYSLYWGVSGITYFLTALYAITKDANYLFAIKESLRWAEWESKNYKSANYSFLNGQMGIAFTYLHVYKVTNEKKYLTKAHVYAKTCQKALQEDTIYNEYLDGIASTLLGFLHLYAVSNEEFLLESITELTNELIKNAKLAKDGIYWDTNPRGIRPLCGITHGTAGIGFVFLELGHYFKNPTFYFIAEQAFAYEDSFYDAKEQNWPDFRLGIVEQGWKKMSQAYLNGKTKEFTGHRYLSSWCHGAGGIGLTRIRAFELLKKKSYAKDFKNAKENIQKHHHTSYTLCHGEGGNADVYIEEYLLSHDKKSLESAQKIADEALQQKKELGMYVSGIQTVQTKIREDVSIFNGLAGIGYFMLRVYDPVKISSFLVPKVFAESNQKKAGNKYPVLQITESVVKEKLLSKNFPQTYQLLREQLPQELKKFYTNNSNVTNIRSSFIVYMNTFISDLPYENNEKIKEIFTIEKLKINIAEENSSNVLLLVRERINQERAEKFSQLSVQELEKISLHLDQTIKIVQINGIPHLFKPSIYETYHTPINKFSELVILSFKKKRSIQKVIQELYKLYEATEKNMKKEIHDGALKQIKDAIRFSILVE